MLIYSFYASMRCLCIQHSREHIRQHMGIPNTIDCICFHVHKTNTKPRLSHSHQFFEKSLCVYFYRIHISISDNDINDVYARCFQFQLQKWNQVRLLASFGQ